MKLAFQYMKKRWLYLSAYSVLPALALTLTAHPTNIFRFFTGFFETDYSKFSTVFHTVTQLNWGSFFLHLAVCVLCAIFIAGMSGAIERDMRLGSFDNKNFFRRVNQNFISCFITVFSLYLMMEIYGLLCSSLLFLWCRAIGGTAAFALSLATVLALFAILFTVCIYFLLWYPVMVISGNRIGNSISQSINYVKGHFWKLALSLIVLMIPVLALVFVGVYFKVKFLFLLNIVPYAFFIIYIVSLMFSAYFDLAGLEREDLNQKPFWQRGEDK